MRPRTTLEKIALLIAVIYGAVAIGGAVVILLNL
jgi:hypothetical protein